MFPTNDPRFLSYRRELRVNQTIAEIALWRRLRNGQLNDYKIYRQFGVGPFILDFYCNAKKLAIELDGSQHAEPEHLEYDKRRTAFLNSQGITVIRFWNNEVMENMDAVIEKIREFLK